jgi:hypothetical protein
MATFGEMAVFGALYTIVITMIIVIYAIYFSNIPKLVEQQINVLRQLEEYEKLVKRRGVITDSTIVAMTSQMPVLKENQAALARDIKGLYTGVGLLESNVRRNRTFTSNVAADLKQHQFSNTAAFSNLRSFGSNVSQQMGFITRRLDGNDKMFISVGSNMKALTGTFTNNVNTLQRALESRINTSAANVNTFETAFYNKLEDVNNRFSAADSALLKRVMTVDERVTRGFANTTSRFELQNTNNTVQQASIANLQTQVAANTAINATINKRSQPANSLRTLFENK